MLKKCLCFVIGVDAFLFKVRVAYKNIHREDIDFFNLLTVAMFIVQVLGIVQLSMFVRGRIFLFIFGGLRGMRSIGSERGFLGPKGWRF